MRKGGHWPYGGSRAPAEVIRDSPDAAKPPSSYSEVDSSFTAHQYLIAAQAGGTVDNPLKGIPWGCDSEPGNLVPTLLPNRTDGPGIVPCLTRLARQFGKRFGDSAYAFEELVAELTAAFLLRGAGDPGTTAASRVYRELGRRAARGQQSDLDRRRTLSAIKALLTTGFKMGALRFNVGAALRLPKVVSRRAERRLEEIELFRLLTAVENKPRDRAIIEALYGTGARVDELVQLRRRQLVADIDGPGGYATLYGKHGGRTIRVGRRTWEALQLLAEGKEPDERIIAITDERIRQILAAAAEAAELKKKLSPHWLRHAHGSHAHQRGAPAATIRDTLGHASLSTTDLYLSSAPTDGSSLYLQF
jgi:site-specific recombinase XerD